VISESWIVNRATNHDSRTTIATGNR